MSLTGHWEHRILSDGIQERFVYDDGFYSAWIYIEIYE